ncbi:GNAT family N-acetyltransferase [Streptomyces sp. NBC_00102]|uniref:GNAT family N-acetyltransferase n=1 Tax=Streptomyces sp. NBC_00102 TaxID=2975652 RepID=UPI0022547817|nr:GNAT family N-acetyltransferase [Streptomyces sp. NBC_00102]MCX5402336.1 GNAT family N-acetyltransferase [Streptomyces sp. NBC_00102]
MTGTRIRLLQEDDWDALVVLEERAYRESGLTEGREALRSRHRSSPSTCFVLEYEGGFGGYLLALPYPLDRCPDLSRAEVCADQENVRESGRGRGRVSNLHLHDVVIAERARGRGLARRMVRHLEETGRVGHYRTLSLVAVQGSREMWTRLGCRARPGTVLPASYGAGAVYMTKPLETATAAPAQAPSSAAEAG